MSRLPKLTERSLVILEQLRTAKCECGHYTAKHKPMRCFEATPNRQEWCWPCTYRWSLRADAARFIAPIDDVTVIRTKVAK